MEAREQFFPVRCLSRYALEPAAVRSDGDAVGLEGCFSTRTQQLFRWAGAFYLARRERAARLPKQLFFSFATSLVTRGGAIYNPSNTALGAVVSFTHTPVLNRQTERLQLPRAGA